MEHSLKYCAMFYNEDYGDQVSIKFPLEGSWKWEDRRKKNFRAPASHGLLFLFFFYNHSLQALHLQEQLFLSRSW